ncbi:beta-glucosidase H [Nocardioides sp. NPDC051685]|uniref:beta-glucosidase H n=1 Tax=Nocardioides sp. NPDC051685 TaxID=3364334 RepID=UPI0037AC8C60
MIGNDLDSAPSAQNAELERRLNRLTLEEKVQLLTGRDFWTTWPLERIGLRRILVSDGPSGVRGEAWDERSPSLNLPSATALSASWDITIADRYGAASAREARRKNVDVVLGPTINLHRSPLGGRHFEAFSEDPILTAELAAAYVVGVQRNGVGATPKHYVANDFETDRFTADVQVDERTLREVYLRAFEKAIVEAQAWLVMSAYNSVNGATMTENELLETPLKSEWGFDGVVISDWTAVRSIASAEHPQDLVMPGPDGPWGEALVAAVRAGAIPEAVVDRKVLRILRLAARVGALDGVEQVSSTPVDLEDDVAFAREAAAEGTVLARNDGILPLEPSGIRSVAVIGHNARDARTQGGGSATVLPEKVVSPLAGIREAFPEADVSYSIGAVVQEGVVELPLDTMTNPTTGEPGARVRFLDAEGGEMFVEDRRASALVYFGGEAPVADAALFEFTTRYTPAENGTILLGFAGVGEGRVLVDGEAIVDVKAEPVGSDLGAAFLTPPSNSAPVEVTAATPIDIRFELRPLHLAGMGNAMSVTIGTEQDTSEPSALIAEAAAAARAADVAVLVVGTNSRVESEGYDRSSLALPGRQDELVEAVLAANPRTIVIVNSGAPVELPWRDRTAALLLSWFGGQEYGHALADVLTGVREAGGRLPTTWPKRLEDAPVSSTTPIEGVVRYEEGVHIGYRAWLKAGIEPAFPFGFGLGYTTWSLGSPEVRAHDTGWTVEVPVANTGQRAGKHVVQVYAERPDSTVDRPVRWLVGFAAVRAAAGTEQVIRATIPRRALEHWDGGWTLEPGEYVLRIGTSVADLPETVTVCVP